MKQKYVIIKEVKFNDGEKETWYIVRPTLSKLGKFLHWLCPLAFPRDYDPCMDLKEARRVCALKNKDQWAKTLSQDIL